MRLNDIVKNFGNYISSKETEEILDTLRKKYKIEYTYRAEGDVIMECKKKYPENNNIVVAGEIVSREETKEFVKKLEKRILTKKEKEDLVKKYICQKIIRELIGDYKLFWEEDEYKECKRLHNLGMKIIYKYTNYTKEDYENEICNAKKIKKIEISNKNLFQQWDLKWDLNKDVNIIFGKNGTGKTTILKTIFYILQKNTDVLKIVK